MECAKNVVSDIVKDTSPSKTMACNNSVYSNVVENSGVVKDTSPFETMECDDNVHSSFVHTKVKSGFPFVSGTIGTGNSYSSDFVDTLSKKCKMIPTLLRL